MLEVGWSEILVIALILIIVVGPKDLPPMLRTFGRMANRLRGMANEFKGQFDQALREAELDDVRKGLSEVNKLNPTNSLRDAMNPIRQLGQDIKADLQKASDMSKPATPVMTAEGEKAAEETPVETIVDAATGTSEGIDLADVVDAIAPAEPPVASATTSAASVVQAGVAPVAPPTPDKAVQPVPAAAAQASAPAIAEPVKPAADVRADEPKAAPRTRKAPVRTKDAAVAAVETEAAAKKPSSRKKPAPAVELVPDPAAPEAKPKKTASRKKAEKAGDA